MKEQKYGTIKEMADQVIYEIPKSQTNIIDAEQLEELNRKDDLFFDFKRYSLDGDVVRIYYQKPQGYKPLSSFKPKSNDVKVKAAMTILAVEKLVGTQYTTLIHPDNIYVNEQGDVQFAQRGIRFVLSTDELTRRQVVREVKPIIIGLFSAVNYEDVNSSNMDELAQEQPIIREIQKAVTIKELRNVISQFATTTNASKADGILMKNFQKYNKSKIIVPAGLVLGMVLGMLLLYVIKVVPMTEASTADADQQEELTELKEALEAEIAENDKIIDSYYLAVTGQVEEAIAGFEGVEKLDEEAQHALIEQYIKLGTVDSLNKASKLDPSYHVKVVKELRSIEGEEAEQAILEMESDAPEVTIEQAWINEDFERVIDIYDDISDNDRAKYLAGRSYLELDNHKEALKLGEELNNKDLQVDSLKLKKEEIKSKDMKKKKKENEIKKIDKQIKEIRES
ncbi:type VII secretion protein EssB/YukC [Oceanobacillus sp. CFH 90083]|uniref:type VII secretion protein EssB/YukC n=1 Tax=Oceanobacillus sp. CFH 90083 TaxID=2592336 RepID=UPI001883D74A|nr:type VII secretion protein EssB/YukC [Oceanobacillus sp. CFH 90083]